MNRVLQEAIRYEGSTLADGTYRTVLNNPGGYQNRHRVYDRTDELCPTCQATQIQRIVQAQRSTFFCPLPAAPVRLTTGGPARCARRSPTSLRR